MKQVPSWEVHTKVSETFESNLCLLMIMWRLDTPNLPVLGELISFFCFLFLINYFSVLYPFTHSVLIRSCCLPENAILGTFYAPPNLSLAVAEVTLSLCPFQPITWHWKMRCCEGCSIIFITEPTDTLSKARGSGLIRAEV